MRLTFGLVGGFPWDLTLTLEVVDDILHHNLEAARTLQACCWYLDAILVVDAFTGLRGWNPLLLQFPPTFQPPCHRELISLNLQAGQGRAEKQSLVDKDMADCSLDPHFLFSGGGEESITNLNSQTLKSYRHLRWLHELSIVFRRVSWGVYNCLCNMQSLFILLIKASHINQVVYWCWWAIWDDWDNKWCVSLRDAGLKTCHPNQVPNH